MWTMSHYIQHDLRDIFVGYMELTHAHLVFRLHNISLMVN